MTEAPTFFGSVSYLLDCRQDGATLTLSNRWKEKGAPTAVVLHLPCWFLKDVSATVDGETVAIVGNAVALVRTSPRSKCTGTGGRSPS